MRRLHLSWRSHAMVMTVAATFSAAALVVFLQQRAISALQSQTRTILRQLSGQTAADIAAELHRTLDGPVFDTVTGVHHPELREGRFDLVAHHYTAGLDAYPHVDRFVVWHAMTKRCAPGEVMFFGRDGEFRPDPDLGRAVMAPRPALHADATNLRRRRRAWRAPARAGLSSPVLERCAPHRLVRRARLHRRSGTDALSKGEGLSRVREGALCKPQAIVFSP